MLASFSLSSSSSSSSLSSSLSSSSSSLIDEEQINKFIITTLALPQVQLCYTSVFNEWKELQSNLRDNKQAVKKLEHFKANKTTPPSLKCNIIISLPVIDGLPSSHIDTINSDIKQFEQSLVSSLLIARTDAVKILTNIITSCSFVDKHITTLTSFLKSYSDNFVSIYSILNSPFPLDAIITRVRIVIKDTLLEMAINRAHESFVIQKKDDAKRQEELKAKQMVITQPEVTIRNEIKRQLNDQVKGKGKQKKAAAANNSSSFSSISSSPPSLVSCI